MKINERFLMFFGIMIILVGVIFGIAMNDWSLLSVGVLLFFFGLSIERN